MSTTVTPLSELAIRIEENASCKRQLFESLTGVLLLWFGLPDANLRYARDAEESTGWVASIDGTDVALALLKHHGPSSAELYWLAINPAYHRRGIGSELVETVCDTLVRDGIRFLFVMSLHPDDPDETNQRARNFFEKLGFTLALSDLDFADKRNRLAYYVKHLPR